MASYGTIMIGKLAEGVTADDWQKGLAEWKRERNVPGFQGEYSLVTDDGRTIVNCVVFESRDQYFQLADDPVQDEWYRTKIAPLLDGDPQWIDGYWV